MVFKQDGYRVIVNCGKKWRARSNAFTFSYISGKQLGEKIV